MRKAHKVSASLAVLVAVFALVAGVGVRSAKPAVDASKTPSLKPAAVSLRVKGLPFTPLDVVFLLAGGAMLLVAGTSIRRVRVEREEN